MNYRNRNLLFVDCEMTGLDVDKHEIIEIACLEVKWENFEIKSKYYSKIVPQHIETANADSLIISGYTQEKWKDAGDPHVVYAQLATRFPNAIPAGWNVYSDWTFLRKALNTYNVNHTFDYHVFEVSAFAYMYLYDKPGIEEINLRSVAKYLEVDISNDHDAMGDIMATYHVFKKLIHTIKL